MAKDLFYPPISVIMPAYCEEDFVSKQIEAVRETLVSHELEHEIIVVDDGSKDRTADEALLSGVRLLSHPENRGYGAALKTGIQAAKNDLIVIIDADGTYPAEAIPDLVNQLSTADMVVGARTGEKVHDPWIRQPAKWLLRGLATWISGQSIPDLNSGLRAFRRECVMQYFPVLPNRFSFTSTVTLAYMADDYQVIYHPINYYSRVGSSKIVPWHFMDFLILIIRMSMMFNPLKVFVPLALIFGGLGVIKTLYDMIALFFRNPTKGWELLLEPVLSTSAVLLLFIGLQLMMIGMVADGVVRRIAQYNRPSVPSQSNWEIDLEANLQLEEQDLIEQ